MTETHTSSNGGAASTTNDPQPCVQTLLVDGRVTEIIDLPPTASDVADSRPLSVLVIPGNPGLAGFYTEYAAALHNALGKSARVVVVGHLGHTESPPLSHDTYSVYSLQDQIQHKIRFLEVASGASSQSDDATLASANNSSGSSSLQATTPSSQTLDPSSSSSNGDWVVVGHSIGAHMALRLKQKLPGTVLHVVGLFPFLQFNHQSKDQKVLKFLTSLMPVVRLVSAVASWMLGLLPQGTREGAVRAVIGRGWSKEAVQSTADGLLQYRVLHNYAYMGRTEFQDATHKVDWPWLESNASAVSLLFGQDDHWGPTALLNEIHERVPALEAVEDGEGHSHTFCCFSHSSRAVATATAATICKRLNLQWQAWQKQDQLQAL